ncbi:hypothetical protein [Mesorhizobium sp. A623]
MISRMKNSSVGRLVELLGSAIVVAAAVEGGRRPFDRDLHVLGIDPRQFNKIRHF